ncbi:hypothetical protein Bbelb_278860 [Branchiostoma belcheri]|nr:hypothetical protein Bbelb_278860 [Branchiostoma belcheri]
MFWVCLVCGLLLVTSAVTAPILITHLLPGSLDNNALMTFHMGNSATVGTSTSLPSEPQGTTSYSRLLHNTSFDFDLSPTDNVAARNECGSKPCLHGRCVNQDGGYKCTCFVGWSGQNCQQAHCLHGWKEYKNHCYKLMTKKLKFSKAQQKCREMGANLASVRDRQENKFIARTISDIFMVIAAETTTQNF